MGPSLEDTTQTVLQLLAVESLATCIVTAACSATATLRRCWLQLLQQLMSRMLMKRLWLLPIGALLIVAAGCCAAAG
jgi:hypothetical protein